jgi:hypothetical protein
MSDNVKNRYVCKRIRMLSALKKLGFEPYDIAADFNNPKYNVYFFDLDEPGLKEAIDNYFKEINFFKS